jgi:diguanylate cyclase (GGDEF)-like protein
MIYDVTEIHRLMEKLKEAAERDALTGLYNRGTFFALAEMQLASAARYGVRLAVLMMDIDFFKAVNDTYGHPGGDEALKAVAEILRGRLREADIIGRYGGEEFCALLVVKDMAAALRVAEEIRTAVEAYTISFEGQEIRFTISIGAALYDEERQMSIEALFREADGAMYRAKREGRNCSRCLSAGTENNPSVAISPSV